MYNKGVGSMSDYRKKYALAEQTLRSFLTDEDKYYEIVEDSYEYKYGLILIIYYDDKHEYEKVHYCTDIESVADLDCG